MDAFAREVHSLIGSGKLICLLISHSLLVVPTLHSLLVVPTELLPGHVDLNYMGCAVVIWIAYVAYLYDGTAFLPQYCLLLTRVP